MGCPLIRETKLSSQFVDDTIREYGSQIWIQLQHDPLRVGTPDIYVVTDGIFIPMESKKVYKDSGQSILAHPFKRMQIKRMHDLLKVRAYPIGLIFYKLEKRYILPLAIREDGQISMEEYLKLPLFDWEVIRNAATKAHCSGCNRRQV